MCADIPNAFIQAEILDISDGEERATMKITGVVDMLVQLSPKGHLRLSSESNIQNAIGHIVMV